MTVALAPSNRRFHERRDDGSLTPETLLRDAAILLAAAGILRSGSWLNRTIREYTASPVDGMPFGLYLVARLELNDHQRRALAERADLRYLLTYPDPTGETAVRNVTKERGW